jgi:NAD(P)H-flavin reductase
VTPVPVPSGGMEPDMRRVRGVARDTHDTFTLELEGEGRGAFRPGQFHMIWSPGVGEAAISLSGDPANPSPIVHTIREVGTVTRALSRLRRGDLVGLRGPFGVPWPIEQASGRDVVVVAGGIGLAPLRPLLHEIASRRNDFGRVAVLYGCRSPEDILFRPQLERWREDHGIRVLVTVDRAVGVWPGNVGVVTTLIPRAEFEPDTAVAYLCGPEIMMRFAALALERRGVHPSRIVVSLERNMKCGIGRCGHCQLGPTLVCRDGPIYPFDRVRGLLELREV